MLAVPQQQSPRVFCGVYHDLADPDAALYSFQKSCLWSRPLRRPSLSRRSGRDEGGHDGARVLYPKLDHHLLLHASAEKHCEFRR